MGFKYLNPLPLVAGAITFSRSDESLGQYTVEFQKLA